MSLRARASVPPMMKVSFMNKGFIARLLAASVSLAQVLASVQAADSAGTPEKSKAIEVVKPAIAKPTDALVPKAKDGKQAEVSQSVGKTIAADAATTTPAMAPGGRPINDVKVMPGASSSANSATPKGQRVALAPPAGNAQVHSTSSAPQATTSDSLEERIRGLLKEKLGTNSEVLLRVSPDSPLAKSDATVVAGEKNREQLTASRDATQQISQPQPVAMKSSEGHQLPWDWLGPRGQQTWGRLDPAYSACSGGSLQSPPEINEQQVLVSIGPSMPQFSWQEQGFQWRRQGPLWTANLDGRSRTEFRDETFSLAAIQFRFPGEPFVGKQRPEGSVHLIHRQDKRMLIIAVPIEIEDRGVPSNEAIRTLLRRFPIDTTDGVDWAGFQMNPQHLLPASLRSAFLFSGSLSFPPCTENVLWLLAKESIILTRSQFVELASLMGKGSRQQQPLNGRPVLGLTTP